MRILALTIICSMLFLSCRKSKSCDLLVGEWKLVETSHIGASWDAITAAEEHTLIFKDDGAYILNTSTLSSFSGCKGTYAIDGSMLEVAPECYSTPPLANVMSFTVEANVLVLNHLMTNTGVKAKYIRQ